MALSDTAAGAQIAVQFVGASRRSKDDFSENSPLAKSLARLRKDRRFTARLIIDNTLGLPLVYNHAIEADDEADVLVFLHDDVWIDDIFIFDHLQMAMQHFDIVGVAGSAAGTSAGKTSWFEPREVRRGAIAHGDPFGKMSRFGPSPAACDLLDGVFIAARKQALRDTGVRFDPAFPFHFYDLDFCRSAKVAGLRIGVWPISLTHQSRGAFHSPEWLATRDAYLSKWKAVDQLGNA